MSKFEENFKKCVSLDESDKNSNLSISLIKLGEETGELNEAYLRSINYKKANKETTPLDDMKEECIDTMIMSFVIANKLKMSLEEINDIMSKKIVKWETKYIDKKQVASDPIRYYIQNLENKFFVGLDSYNSMVWENEPTGMSYMTLNQLNNFLEWFKPNRNEIKINYIL